MPTYAITADSTVTNEGSIVNFTVETTEVEDGTIFYWTLGTFADANDMVDGVTSGPVTIINNVASFSLGVKDDLTLEGDEYLLVHLRTDIEGSILATSDFVLIIDNLIEEVAVDPENGRLRRATSADSALEYYTEGTWYRVPSTAIQL